MKTSRQHLSSNDARLYQNRKGGREKPQNLKVSKRAGRLLKSEKSLFLQILS